MNFPPVFNCDNDLALANFSPGFTPPSSIQQMMQELADLPLSWEETDGGRMPVWGWSPAVCHRLRQMGYPEEALPSQSQLQEIRRLSSRGRAVELLSAMREEGLCDGFLSVTCTDETQVEEALSRWPRTILKAPWSGSGKGLRYGQGGREDTLRGWYRRILARQGCVVVEPLYDKLHDLAMEFYSNGTGVVTYQGLSLFETHPNGAYSGSLLLSESEKEAWLHRFVDPRQVLIIRQWLEQHLGQMIGTAYRGYLGVDMMIVKAPHPSTINHEPSTLNSQLSTLNPQPSTIIILHPMVEVNLRMTMGMVSILLQRRRPSDFRGVFRLDYFADSKEQERDTAARQQSSSFFQVLASGPHYRAYIQSVEG